MLTVCSPRAILANCLFTQGYPCSESVHPGLSLPIVSSPGVTRVHCSPSAILVDCFSSPMPVLARCLVTQGYHCSLLVYLRLSLLIVGSPRAILQSGCRLCYWTYNATMSPLSVARRLGSSLQCPIIGDDTGMASFVSVIPLPLRFRQTTGQRFAVSHSR